MKVADLLAIFRYINVTKLGYYYYYYFYLIVHEVEKFESLMAQLKSFGSINQLSCEIFGSCECKLILLLLYVMRLLKLLFMDVV